MKMKKETLLINGLGNQTVSEAANEIYELEKEAWDESMRVSFERIAHRLNIFSGGMWRLYSNNRLVSYMFFIKLNALDVLNYNSWHDYCADGSCNNHTDSGTVLFGVSIGSIEKGMGTYIFNEGIDLILSGRYESITEIRMCSRIPTLSNQFKGREIISLDLNNPVLLNDPVVKMILNKGFYPIHFCKDGFSVDKESLGYSLTMRRSINENTINK